MRLGVPVMLSAIVAAAAGWSAPQGRAQELRVACDADRDGALTAEEAQGCAEQRFDLVRGDAAGLAEEQFAAALPDANGLRQQFVQADRDGDGRISREEWLAWFGPAYSEATRTVAGPVNGTD